MTPESDCPTPRFSILHPTRRFPGWKQSYDKWLSRCTHPERVEYVLCVDECDAGHFWKDQSERLPRGAFAGILAINSGRRSSTPAYNCAASFSTGELLICNADDVFPPLNWDCLINVALYQICDPKRWTGMMDGGKCCPEPAADDFVLHVSTPAGGERDRAHIFQPIVSRARYQKLGYFFYPEYDSMYADDDLTAQAYKDGVVIEAPWIQLEHRHPCYGTAPLDEIYQWENRPEAYQNGERIFKRRQAEGFPQ